MKRLKLGDVFAVKVPNGYKLYQWAYNIPKHGEYIRVLKGLYNEIPSDIDRIVKEQHNFVINFNFRRAYRIGLSQLLGTFPVPKEYPLPDYNIDLCQNIDGEIYCISFAAEPGSGKPYRRFKVSSIEQLPYEFQGIRLINGCVSPDWLLYLFDTDFDFTDLRRFFPAVPGQYKEVLTPYWETVSALLEKEEQRKQAKNKKDR